MSTTSWFGNVTKFPKTVLWTNGRLPVDTGVSLLLLPGLLGMLIKYGQCVSTRPPTNYHFFVMA